MIYLNEFFRHRDINVFRSPIIIENYIMIKKSCLKILVRERNKNLEKIQVQ